MKIAVTYESGLVFQYFGHAPAFKLYTVEGGKITAEAAIPQQPCQPISGRMPCSVMVLPTNTMRLPLPVVFVKYTFSPSRS